LVGIKQKTGEMKVMLPIADKKSGKETVARGFHNAQYICIYDSHSKSFEWMAAKEMNHNPGDFSRELQRLGIKTVISAYLPPMALRIFARNGLDVYKARGINVEENIGFFSRNQLESFTTQEARETWGCKSSCGSCSSTSCKN
jgi:predicted Fe-Mo cluster-binding NifX family protein